MAEVIKFKKLKNKKKDKPENDIKNLLGHLLKENKNIDQILIFIKDKAQDVTMLYSALSTQDKAFMLQLLQYDLNEEFASGEIDP